MSQKTTTNNVLISTKGNMPNREDLEKNLLELPLKHSENCAVLLTQLYETQHPGSALVSFRVNFMKLQTVK